MSAHLLAADSGPLIALARFDLLHLRALLYQEVLVPAARQDYRYALVSWPDRSYLWLLARSSTLDAATRDRLVARAAAAGFDTSKLIFVDQSALP